MGFQDSNSTFNGFGSLATRRETYMENLMICARAPIPRLSFPSRGAWEVRPTKRNEQGRARDTTIRRHECYEQIQSRVAQAHFQLTSQWQLSSFAVLFRGGADGMVLVNKAFDFECKLHCLHIRLSKQISFVWDHCVDLSNLVAFDRRLRALLMWIDMELMGMVLACVSV